MKDELETELAKLMQKHRKYSNAFRDAFCVCGEVIASASMQSHNRHQAQKIVEFFTEKIEKEKA